MADGTAHYAEKVDDTQQLLSWLGNHSRRKKTEFKQALLYLKNDIVLHPDHGEGVG